MVPDPGVGNFRNICTYTQLGQLLTCVLCCVHLFKQYRYSTPTDVRVGTLVFIHKEQVWRRMVIEHMGTKCVQLSFVVQVNGCFVHKLHQKSEDVCSFLHLFIFFVCVYVNQWTCLLLCQNHIVRGHRCATFVLILVRWRYPVPKSQ